MLSFGNSMSKQDAMGMSRWQIDESYVNVLCCFL